ncbi:MAG: cell envelope integrity EipB family protein [Sneathiella sp.]
MALFLSRVSFAAGIFSLVGIVFFGSAFTADAGGVPLASHRAVYDLTLNKLFQEGGIQDVRGRIVMEMENQCEGYVLNQRMLIELANLEGDVITSDFHLSTWEDKAGNTMRFSMSNILNGQPVEKSDGVATMSDTEGSVSFKDEEPEKLTLPKGVLFPTAHTRKILQSAIEGKNLISAKIYDGNGHEGLQDSLTVIGKRQTAEAGMTKRNEMKGLPFWPVQLAYFDLDGQTNEPDYEVSISLYQNGVASDLTLKYKDFSLAGELVQLDFLEAADCSKH